MRVVVTGGKNFSDIDLVHKELSALPPDTVIINGGNKGADQLCAEVAEELGLHVRTFPAQWSRYGKQAGAKRNHQMLQAADRLLVFPGGSSTANCIAQAQACGIEIVYAGRKNRYESNNYRAKPNAIRKYDSAVMKKRLSEVQALYPEHSSMLSKIGADIRTAKERAGQPGEIDSVFINSKLGSAAFKYGEPEKLICLDVMHAIADAIEGAKDNITL